MSIRFSKYINITSAVGGASQVALRQWCGRIFTTNPMVGPSSVLQFASATDVGEFFGTTSEEYLRAVSYFGYISPVATQAQAIQFARWVESDQPVSIYGAESVAVLSALQAVTAGSLKLQFGNGTPVTVSGISFSAATSLADVASELQTALRAVSSTPELTTATVTYDTVRGAFDVIGSSTGVVAETLAVLQSGSGNSDVANLMGLYSGQGAIINDALPAETKLAGVQRVMSLTNNCGEFGYTDAADLSQSEAVSIAQWNATQNVTFIFRVRVTEATWSAMSAALIGIAGCGLEFQLSTLQGAQFIEMLPMSIHAAINYNAVNGAAGFMYKQAAGNYTASVTTDPVSDELDAARVNYYGQTQTAGQNLSFYQRGVMCGGSTAPQDSTVYANEQWLKDTIGANFMNLQLSQNQIPANNRGIAMGTGVLQAAINQATSNGTISVNGTLTQIQQAFITSQTGDATAWQQVQNIGYWFNITITSSVAESGVTEYALAYTLIYRKDDVIKTINGTHELI